MAVPSDVTMPERARSNGRLARSGSRSPVTIPYGIWPASSAGTKSPSRSPFASAYPPSVPPASATSARPARIRSAACPSASSDDAHAVVMVSWGPCRSYIIEICAAAMLGQILMSVLRSIAATPPRSRSCWAFRAARPPPMLVPWTTAVRRGSRPPSPDCSTACRVAAIAHWANRSVPPATRGDIHSAGSKPETAEYQKNIPRASSVHGAGAIVTASPRRPLTKRSTL